MPRVAGLVMLLVLIAVGAIVLWPAQDADIDEQRMPTKAPTAEQPTHGTEMVIQSPGSSALLTVPTLDAPALDELRRQCPDPWTLPLPVHCADALRRRYEQEGARSTRLHDGTIGWWWPNNAPLAAEVSWVDAFTDPEGTRGIVEEALGKPECAAFVVRDSKETFGIADGRDATASTPLREACAADEAAKLAMLHMGCVLMLVTSGRLDLSPENDADSEAALARMRDRDAVAHRHEEPWAWAVEDLDDDPTLTTEEYWARRDEIDDGRFRFAWRRLMCRAVPSETFALLDGLPEPGHDIHQGHHLRRYAGRLGNEWALAVAERKEEEVWGPED